MDGSFALNNLMIMEQAYNFVLLNKDMTKTCSHGQSKIYLVIKKGNSLSQSLCTGHIEIPVCPTPEESIHFVFRDHLQSSTSLEEGNQ